MNGYRYTGDVNGITIIQQVSLSVYQTLVQIQQENPAWLNERYRDIPLQNHQTALTSKLTALLSPIQEREKLVLKLRQCLQPILLPPAFESAIYQQLIEQVNQSLLASPLPFDSVDLSFNQAQPNGSVGTKEVVGTKEAIALPQHLVTGVITSVPLRVKA